MIVTSNTQEEQIIKQIKLLVTLFLKYNESDIELSERTGISSSTVGRRLTDKERILKAFPDNGEKLYNVIAKKRKENKYNGKVMGGQISMLNHSENNDNTKLRIDLIYNDEERQIRLLKHMALTYRVKLPLLAELFGIDENTLLDKLLEVSGESYNSLMYLFYHDFSDQEIARRDLISFYQLLLVAKKRKDTTTQNLLIRKVSDYHMQEVIKKHEEGKAYTDNEIETILKYQLKYALSSSQIAKMIGIRGNSYNERVLKLIELSPELKEQYDVLANYKQVSFINDKLRGRRE